MTVLFSAPTKKVALVTGAARGIGAAISQRLAQDGHDIAIIDLNAEACAQTVQTVESCGRRALAIAADVSKESDVERAIAAVAESLGAPTVLVNNAGVLRDRALAKMTLEDWETVIGVNLRSVFLMCRAVQPYMREAQWGRIVNLSSIAALGVIGEANYSAAKAGVQGISKTLAIELGRHGITVNVVAPGFIVTEMTREVAVRINVSFEELTQEMMRGIYVGRPGEPADIANAVAFFTDERSAFVTGQVLYVAGAPRG